MSQNGGPHQSDAPENPPPLELFIETVMGTTFEVNALPNDSIMSIKLKISRFEGIPSSQQHLLYNMKELDNSSTISDHSIQDGATLKLIVSMRVGPITTKRFPEVDELAWRELQELLSDSRKDDLYDRLPPGTKLTVLIFQDGDQVHFLKVLEHEDGTFSPMADAWNGSSIRTLYSKGNHHQSDDREEENTISMAKMQELKERLDALSLQKKEKKSNEADPNTIRRCRRRNGRKDNLKTVRVVSYLNGGMKNLPFPSRKSQRDVELADGYRSHRRDFSFSRLAMAGFNKMRKDAGLMFKLPTPLSSLLDSSSKRPPLPEIRRSSTTDKEKVMSQDDKLGKNLGENTAGCSAGVEKENGFSPESSACSSQSSAVALPSNKEVAANAPFPLMSNDTVPTTPTGNIFKVKGCELENDEGPKTTPTPALLPVETPTSAPAPAQSPVGRLTLTPTPAQTPAPDLTTAQTPVSSSALVQTPIGKLTLTATPAQTPIGRLTLTPTPALTSVQTPAAGPTPAQTPVSGPIPVQTPGPTSRPTRIPVGRLTLTLTPSMASAQTPASAPTSVQTPALGAAPVETLTLTLTSTPFQNPGSALTPGQTPPLASAPVETMTLTLTPAPGQTPATAPTPGQTPATAVTPGQTPATAVTPGQTPATAVTPGQTPAAAVTPGQTPATAVTPGQTPTQTVTPGQTPAPGRAPHRRVTLTLTPSKLDGEKIKPGIIKGRPIFPDPNKGLLSQLSRLVPITKVVTYENGIRKEWRPQESAAPSAPKPNNLTQGDDPGRQPSAKKHMRCLKCKKKVNITNTYNCRCGGPFCSVHRYSEVHDCPFDYKRQCKKPLWQTNPLFAAQKLPKI